jgi:hypothetical protein
MKGYKVGIVSVAVLLAMAGIGFGIAQAGGADWNVEALDSYHVYQQENRPVLSFDDQELTQMAKSPSGDMSMESPIETGSLSSGNETSYTIVESGGVNFRGEIDAGP